MSGHLMFVMDGSVAPLPATFNFFNFSFYVLLNRFLFCEPALLTREDIL